VAPAIDAALRKVNSHSLGGATSHGAYPSFNLTVSYADSMCDSAESLNHAIEFYMTGQVRRIIWSIQTDAFYAALVGGLAYGNALVPTNQRSYSARPGY